MRLAVPKDSCLRHAASHGLSTRRYPFIASLVLCYQEQEMETVVAHLKEQDSKIQKVSDQLEVSKPAAQIVLNNH